MVLERLDQALATNSWISLNPATQVQNLHVNSSNHNPIIIKPEGIIACRNKPFQLEQIWMKDQGRAETVMAAWGSSFQVISMPIVSKKIRQWGEKLSEWSQLL